LVGYVQERGIRFPKKEVGMISGVSKVVIEVG
jgi:hypothetical protein